MAPILAMAVAVLVPIIAAPGIARADNFSFTGSFSRDDDVQLFNFTVGATSNDVILRTWSYAGGTNAAGQVIPEGGFDPILALFDSTGALIGQNDDGGDNVPADSVTGAQFDTFLELTTLAPGTYTVAVMQYDNFANGPNLSDGFARTGEPNFTLDFAPAGSTGFFWDVTQHQRTGNWAFDILGVNSAGIVPEPSSLVMGGIGGLTLLGVSLFRRRKPTAA
jgi:hypothetical protein